MTTAEFQAEVKEKIALPGGADPARIIAEYIDSRVKAIEHAKELGVGKDGMADVKLKFIRAFIRRWMMLRYPALDTSFTRRTWWVEIERDGDGLRLIGCQSEKPSEPVSDPVTRIIGEIPRFFSIEMEAMQFVVHGVGKDEKLSNSHTIGDFAHGNRKGKGFRADTVSVSALLPDGITSRHLAIGREAMAHYRIGNAALLKYGINAYTELKLNDWNAKKENANLFRFIWAPNQESLSVTSKPPAPKGDPAMLFEVAGHSFLLDFYDTPDEQPIEHLIREFSEGHMTVASKRLFKLKK